MARDIKIRIMSQADLAAIKTFNGELAKMAMAVGKSNGSMRQSTMLAAREYYSLGEYAEKSAQRTMLSAKQIEAAWKKAMRTQQSEADKSKKNVAGLSRAVEILTSGAGKAAGSVGKMIRGIFQGSVWEIGAAAIRALWDYFKSQSEKAAERAKKANEEFVKSVKDGMSAAAEVFNESAKSMDAYLSKFDTAIDKAKELAKTEVELARQMAIANGMDPAAASVAAADLNSQLDDKAAEEKLNKEIEVQREKKLEAEKSESKVNAELFAAQDAKEKAEKKYNAVLADKIKRTAGTDEGLHYIDNGFTKVKTYVSAEAAAKKRAEVKSELDNSEWGKEQNKLMGDLDAQIKNGEKESKRLVAESEAAQAKIDNANAELDTIAIKREARELAIRNEIAKTVEDEQKAKEKADKEAAAAEQKANVEAAKKAAAEQERLDREAAVRRQQQADKELADKIKNHQKLLQAEQGEAADARSAKSLAESKLQQAWGWYRDKDSMAAQMEEEKADAAAKKQYEKDFEKLKSRHRDWRTVENLSVDEEATRRVALAKEEKEAADKHLAEIEKNTADLAAKLDELLSVKG